MKTIKRIMSDACSKGVWSWLHFFIIYVVVFRSTAVIWIAEDAGSTDDICFFIRNIIPVLFLIWPYCCMKKNRKIEVYWVLLLEIIQFVLAVPAYAVYLYSVSEFAQHSVQIYALTAACLVAGAAALLYVSLFYVLACLTGSLEISFCIPLIITMNTISGVGGIMSRFSYAAVTYELSGELFFDILPYLAAAVILFVTGCIISLKTAY